MLRLCSALRFARLGHLGKLKNLTMLRLCSALRFARLGHLGFPVQNLRFFPDDFSYFVSQRNPPQRTPLRQIRILDYITVFLHLHLNKPPRAESPRFLFFLEKREHGLYVRHAQYNPEQRRRIDSL